MLSFLDSSGLPDVESSHLDLIEWKDGSGIKRKVKIYSSIGCKWKKIARRLRIEEGVIESIENDHRKTEDRTEDVLGKWLNNACGLPNSEMYPKTWQGLINLLQHAERGELAKKLHRALSSPQNSVRGTLS